MTAAYYRSFETTNLYFHTGHVFVWISLRGGKRCILYAVTSGLATVGGIEQPESINNALVDGVVGHLIVAVTEIEATLCSRGGPRGARP